jgi:hypothetical protein
VTITEDGTITPETPAEIIAYGWEVYRRSQQAPFPQDPEAAGTLMRAQSRLWHQVEPHTRTDGRHPPGEPDADAIDDAIDALVAAVEWHCGTSAAAFVSGTEGGEGA